MGIKIGMPIMKLSKNGRTTNNSKRTGKMISVFGEGLGERYSLDPDVDKTLSVNNEYWGYNSCFTLAKDVNEECAEYNVKYKAKTGRSMRSDAIRGFALILKPPIQWIRGLSVTERQKFFDDSDEIVWDIMGGYTDENGTFHSNIRATAKHRDEVNLINSVPMIGEHKHYYGMPYTSDGRICAKELINLKLFRRFN